MSSDKPLSQFWWHVIITGALCLTLFPVFPLIYLAGLAIYYGGGWAGQVLRTGSTHRWFYSVRRFAWALVLSVLMSLHVVLVSSLILHQADQCDATRMIPLVRTILFFNEPSSDRFSSIAPFLSRYSTYFL